MQLMLGRKVMMMMVVAVDALLLMLCGLLLQVMMSTAGRRGVTGLRRGRGVVGGVTMGTGRGSGDVVDGQGSPPGGMTTVVVVTVALVGMASRCGHVTVCGQAWGYKEGFDRGKKEGREQNNERE